MKACIICSNKKFKKLFKNSGMYIEQCVSCGLVRTKDFKTPDYSHYHRDNEYRASEKLFRNVFMTRFDAIGKYYKKAGTILDVGASNGVLLDVFKENGWDTYGVEPSGSAEFLREKGHTAYNSKLEDTNIKNKFFDVIVANHVLEHIVDAKKFLLKCHELLKDDGLLYIDVPNFDSLSAKLGGSEWKYLLPHEHVYHFTPVTLSLLLYESGFVSKEVNTRAGLLETKWPIKFLFDEVLAMRKSVFMDTLSVPGNILSVVLHKGTSLSIISKKL